MKTYTKQLETDSNKTLCIVYTLLRPLIILLQLVILRVSNILQVI